MAFHQLLMLHICILWVQLIVWTWNHANTCSTEIRCDTKKNMQQALMLCDVTTKVLVIGRVGCFWTALSSFCIQKILSNAN